MQLIFLHSRKAFILLHLEKGCYPRKTDEKENGRSLLKRKLLWKVLKMDISDAGWLTSDVVGIYSGLFLLTALA